jgi:ABC-type branched-subunit amino acid transport system substrate-binding protein
MKTKPILIALLVAAAVAVGVWLVKTNSTSGGKVQIATNIPLSGPIAAFSGEYANGLLLGVEEGCKEYGVPRDTFNVDVQDNAGKPAQAVSILEKQRLRGFQAYISGTSDMSNAIAKELDVSSAPHLLVSFDAFLTGKGANRLRILPHYKIEGPMYPKYAQMRGAKRVFSITLNNSAIQEEFNTFVEPELQKAGIQFKREIFDWGFSDYRTLAQKAKEFQPDLIFINGFSVHILPSIQALRAIGMVQDGNILCVMDFLDLLYNDTPKAELAGVVSIAPPYEIPGAVTGRGEWSARYRTKYGKTPNYIPAFAYDTGRLFVLAQKNAHSISKDALKAQMPFNGIAGTIAVDADGDFSSPLGYVKVTNSGELVVVP